MGKRGREINEEKKRQRMFDIARERTTCISVSANAALSAVISNLELFRTMKKALAVGPAFIAECAYEIGVAMESTRTAVFGQILQAMSTGGENHEEASEGAVGPEAAEPGKPEGLAEDPVGPSVIVTP